jgi:hypothetical protein
MKQLHIALCGDSEQYRDERQKLNDMGVTSVTVAVPVIMSILSLPPALAGFAIVLSVFISRVGVNALCETLKQDFESHARPIRRRRTEQGR